MKTLSIFVLVVIVIVIHANVYAHITTATLSSAGCSGDYPVDCGNGWCCPLELPLCGYGAFEGYCFEDDTTTTIGSTTTTTISPNETTTSTTASSGCSGDYPVDCGNGWCCPLEFPLCGYGSLEGNCYEDDTTTTAESTTTTTIDQNKTTTTTTASSDGCSGDYPVDCGNGWCCSLDYPLCGYGSLEGYCYKEDMPTSTTVLVTTSTAPSTTTSVVATTTTIQESSDSITLNSGTLNGQYIDPNDPQIIVAAGSSITGTVNIIVTNNHSSKTVVPVCATPSWEDWGERSTIYWTIDDWTPVGDTSHYVDVNLISPDTEGTYYIFFGSSDEIDCGNIISNTNWAHGDPVWNDGNDFVDFDEDTIKSAIQNGWVEVSKLASSGYTSSRVGANAVKVTVTSEVATTTTPLFTVSIKGTVRDKFSLDPIAGAFVTCGEKTLITDVEGIYYLNQGLGRWVIKVEADAYVTSTEEVVITQGDQPIDKDFFMIPSVQLAGIVKDFDTREPVDKASIKVGDDYASSDEKGKYDLAHPPGDWIIQVIASGYESQKEKLSVSEGELSVEKDFLISKSGLLTVIAGTVTDQVSRKPVDWVEIRTDGGGFTFSTMDGYYNLSQKQGTWTIMAVADGYRYYTTNVTVDQGGQITIDIEMDPINVSTTTTTIDPKATTTTTSVCPSEQIYGEDSEQTELLRHFRDNVLNQTPQGQEIIRLYYEWSPAIVKAMEEDEEFRQEVKKMIDGVLELIGGK